MTGTDDEGTVVGGRPGDSKPISSSTSRPDGTGSRVQVSPASVDRSTSCCAKAKIVPSSA
ncbi:MAG: hypothetical protein R2695_14200 [Acidimicrobiales bacterium]